MQQPPNPYSYNPQQQWQQQPYSQQQQGQSPPPQDWQQPLQLPPTQQPPLQQQPKQEKNWKAIITVVTAVATVIGVMIALLTWLHPFSPAPAHSGVQDTLTEFCNAYVKGDYQTAYSFGSKVAKQLMHEQDYINNATAGAKAHGGMLSCTVDEATDDGSTGHGIITMIAHDNYVQVFQGTLVMEDGSWKIQSFCTPPSACH
jgi:hypothetical protein